MVCLLRECWFEGTASLCFPKILTRLTCFGAPELRILARVLNFRLFQWIVTSFRQSGKHSLFYLKWWDLTGHFVHRREIHKHIWIWVHIVFKIWQIAVFTLVKFAWFVFIDGYLLVFNTCDSKRSNHLICDSLSPDNSLIEGLTELKLLCFHNLLRVGKFLLKFIKFL